MEFPLVQILVVVVIRNLRLISIDVGKGYRLIALRSVLADPKRFVKYESTMVKLKTSHRIEREKG